MSAQTITNRLRILAIAENTKVQYPGNIIQSSPLISTINCNVGFDRLMYTVSRKKCCFPPVKSCNLPSSINGGNPSSLPTYFVDGGIPSSRPSCYVNAGNTCNSPLSINGSNPSSTPSYFVDGGLPSSSPVCHINGGYTSRYFVNAGRHFTSRV